MGTSATSLTSRFNTVDSNIAEVKSDTNKIVNILGTIDGTTIANTLSNANTNILSIKNSTDLIGTATDDSSKNTIFGKLYNMNQTLNTINTTTGNTNTVLNNLATDFNNSIGTSSNGKTLFQKVEIIAKKINDTNTKLTTIEGKIEEVLNNTRKHPINAAVKSAIAGEVSASCTGNANDCIEKILISLQYRGYINLQ